ncbi:MAG: hypothetical protein NWE98_05075 [Candidatus Bathyarchaeota archaeon]|nr:hypothetical protein [Candidatus Bathyarchaeota archaeon]
MPVLNYGLFTKEIRLKYPISQSDASLLQDLLDIFSKDIFINKLIRRKNPYILPEFRLTEQDATQENAKPLATLKPTAMTEDRAICSEFEEGSCGVLSSGGKESLLTYAMLKEAGAKVYPLYVNESGGHWRTALPAYRHHKTNEPNTRRVWLNVDRFYTFMLDHLRIIRPDHRKVWLDTYPIRLCIFPVYVFYLLPLFVAEKIGNLLIGSEFDDPRLSPYYKDIKHYYGVYDQTQDFDLRMEQWYQKRMPNMRQWSAVRPISGLIVERILTSRYPQLAKNQRSCHSCHFQNSEIIPCGSCSKCLGIQLFLRANNIDPAMMGYSKRDISLFAERFAKGGLRLDEDEREHAAFLAGKLDPSVQGIEHAHVETIHLHKGTGDLQLIPKRYRKALLNIIEQYTKGFTKLENDVWVPAAEPNLEF